MSKQLLLAAAMIGTLSFGITMAEKVTATETAISIETKNETIAQNQICFIYSNAAASSMFINTYDNKGIMSTQLEMYKKDLNNLKPIRYKVFDGLHDLRVDEKLRGARYYSKIGTIMEMTLGTAFNDINEIAFGLLSSQKSRKNCTPNFLQKIVKYVHSKMHYMKKYEKIPFVTEYNKYPLFDIKLQNANELRAIIKALQTHNIAARKTKPIAVLTIEDDPNLATLTDEDKNFMKKYFNIVPATDKEISLNLFITGKMMGVLRNRLKDAPHIKLSMLQQVTNPIEKLCEDFDTDRLLPKVPRVIVAGILVGVATYYTGKVIKAAEKKLGKN